MPNFRYVGDNRRINLDNVDELRTRDEDGWVQVSFASGREIQVDRQYIEDLLTDDVPESPEPETSTSESEPETETPGKGSK